MAEEPGRPTDSVRHVGAWVCAGAVLAFFCYVYFERSFGRVWFLTSDPDLTYLVSSAAILIGNGYPEYNDHPGYPIQYATALLLRASGIRAGADRSRVFLDVRDRTQAFIWAPRLVGFIGFAGACIAAFYAGTCAAGNPWGGVLSMAGLLGISLVRFQAPSLYTSHPDGPACGCMLAGCTLVCSGAAQGNRKNVVYGCLLLSLGVSLKFPVILALAVCLAFLCLRWYSATVGKRAESADLARCTMAALAASAIGLIVFLAPFWLHPKHCLWRFLRQLFHKSLACWDTRAQVLAFASVLILSAPLMVPAAYALIVGRRNSHVRLCLTSAALLTVVVLLSGNGVPNYYRFPMALLLPAASVGALAAVSRPKLHAGARTALLAAGLALLVSFGLYRVRETKGLEDAIGQYEALADNMYAHEGPVYVSWRAANAEASWRNHACEYWRELPQWPSTRFFVVGPDRWARKRPGWDRAALYVISGSELDSVQSYMPAVEEALASCWDNLENVKEIRLPGDRILVFRNLRPQGWASNQGEPARLPP